MTRFLILPATLLVAGCTLFEPEPDYKAEFPMVPDAFADQIIEMECSELAITDAALDILANSSGTVARLLALTPQARETLGPVLDQGERVQEQTMGLVNRMGEVKGCAF